MQIRNWLLFPLALMWPMAVVFGGELVGVTPDELKTLQQEGARIIDVRAPEEWQKTGMIPGSDPLTYFDAHGGYDTTAWLQKLNAISPGKTGKIVLVCRSGNRSSVIGKMLADEQGYPKVYHLEKGVREWAAEGNALKPCQGC